MSFCTDPGGYHDHSCPGYTLERIADALEALAAPARLGIDNLHGSAQDTHMENTTAAPTTTTKCAKVYTSRDGGSTLVCTELKGHKDSHYSDGTGPAYQGYAAR